MAIELKMPALSPTMEEGTLAKWLVKEGDTVKSGDLLAEIETDKATMEFEAVDEGVIGKILVPEGSEGVKVGTVIAVLDGEGEEASSAPAPKAEAPVREHSDPIEGAKADLIKMGVPEDKLKDIDKQIRAKVAEAADFAESSPEPAPAELHTDVLVGSY